MLLAGLANLYKFRMDVFYAGRIYVRRAVGGDVQEVNFPNAFCHIVTHCLK